MNRKALGKGINALIPDFEMGVPEVGPSAASVLLVDENKPFCGVGAQISFLIQDRAFDYLDAPIKRVSAIDAPQAYSKVLENYQIPNHDRVLKKALEIL